MVEFRQEQESRDEAVNDKNERIRDLEMELARKSQAMENKAKRLTRRSPSYSMSNALPTRMRTLETSWSRWWMPALLSSTRMVL